MAGRYLATLGFCYEELLLLLSVITK